MGEIFRSDGAALEDFLPPGVVVLRRLQGNPFRRDLGTVVIRRAVESANLTHGVGQIGFRLLQRNFGIARIEQHQRLPLLHKVALIHRNLGHRTADLRSERHLVAVNVGIVGRFIVAGVQQVPCQTACGGKQQNNQ